MCIRDSQGVIILFKQLGMSNLSLAIALLTSVITIVVSFVVFRIVESPLITVGKNVANQYFILTSKNIGLR